ncbi:MAG: precorrin-3B C(17)-methyltransferase [Devosiaceae bacterium]|nr:precorrin-3B C(17)-methyltransferase [Devosiaceae bacterium]
MSASPQPAILYFTNPGKILAKKIAGIVEGSVVNCSSGTVDARQIVGDLFAAKRPIVGICATGILVRLLAEKLQNKYEDPPVLCVSANEKFVIPLLGGHRGANRMAILIADNIGADVAITTASEGRFDFALDAPPKGYVLAQSDAVKSAMAALLNGEKIDVSGSDQWLIEAGYPVAGDGKIKIHVSEYISPVASGDTIVYRPKTLVVGVGCARFTTRDEIVHLIEKALEKAHLSPKSICALASIDIKSDEAGLHAAAACFGVPLRLFPAESLAAIADRVPNPSSVVEAETGTASVAEAAALLAGNLIVPKQKTDNATCAIGKSDLPIDPDCFGEGTGQLHLVGIGPGEKQQRTQSASLALTNATDWVGYSLYLDLVDDMHDRQILHSFDLGDEEPRVRFALELAAKGKNVALICSGDAQIYAMAALVFELLDVEGKRAVSPSAKRLFVESHPGISALQMASARAGALLGHDFCTISLSDLLTPRPDIEKRLHAAATGDFVTAFYNPRSKKRTELIKVAKQIFLLHRPLDTPVVIATNLGREGETVQVVTLEDFDPTQIDMLTIVLFGSSNSKSFLRGDGRTIAYTPRGYANKTSEKK